MLEHALNWAGRGFRLFPLHPNTKRPVWKGWTQDATSDPERIREIWSERDYNIGVLTGNGLIVVDVDVKNGKDGLMSFMMLGLPADTLCVETPSGGFHYYYEGPDVANSSGKIGEGLDVRGKNGFVIAPGSTLGAGGLYKRLDGDGLRSVGDNFVNLCGTPRERSTDVIDVELDDPAAVAFAQQWLDQRPGAVEGAGGDIHTYRTAAKLRDFGLSEQRALDLLAECWNRNCQPPWGDDELRTKVANAYAYGTSAPGSASPQHLFGDVVLPTPAIRPLLDGWHFRDDPPGATVEWLYNEMLPTMGVCLCTGPSNGGKTFVALDLAESLALGRDFFGTKPAERGATLILCGEAFGSTVLRLQALAPGIPVAARYVGGLAAHGALDELGKALGEAAAEMKTRYGVPVRLIILDTLSSSGILENENDNAQAATVMKLFSEISQQMAALFLVLHHPPKSGEGDRGAGAIRNSADYVMTIRREGSAAVRDIEMTKSRDDGTRTLGSFTLVPVDVEVNGKTKRTMRVSQGLPRIREGRAGSMYAGLVVECLEMAWVEHSETIDGAQWVERMHVEAWFSDRWKGRRDAKYIKRNFDTAMAYCVDLGSVEAAILDDRTFIRKKEIG